MEPLEIANLLKERFPEEVLQIKEFRGQVSVVVKKDRILEIMKFLKETPELDFDFLKDLCGVDYLGKKSVRFEVVYTLYSMRHKHMIRIKAEVPEDECEIDSVVSIWRGADWHERECYDLFGIKFRGHPDLRRILLPEDWEGHPLRKDYPVQGPPLEEDWSGYREVINLARELEKYQWKTG